MFVQSVKMAWESVTSNKMRSFLTMLGIIIGVFSLVVLVSIVSGATGSITDTVSGLAPSALQVTIMDNKGNPLSISDVDAMQGEGAIGLTSPLLQDQVTIRSGRTDESATLYGVNENYSSIQEQELEAGRFIKNPDVTNNTNVAVVSTDVVKDVLGTQNYQNAIGQSMTVGGQTFTVIGVLKSGTGTSVFALSSYDVYVPCTTAYRVSSRLSRSVATFVVSAKDGDLTSAESDVGDILLKRFDRDTDAFSIINFDSVMDAMDSVTSTLSLVMGGVAGISLLVGGIGIMNIMLVSVTERTKEIGIRKAIGASRRVILLQFLIEALMLSLIGCVIGIGLSWIALQIVTAIAENTGVTGLRFGLNGTVVMVSVVFSLGIGLIFGLYPANKAAKMKPIDALRYNG